MQALDGKIILIQALTNQAECTGLRLLIALEDWINFHDVMC